MLPPNDLNNRKKRHDLLFKSAEDEGHGNEEQKHCGDNQCGRVISAQAQTTRTWTGSGGDNELSRTWVRELDLDPKTFGSLANHRQETRKIPLPEFIEEIYFKSFGKAQPDNVKSIETVIKDREKKKSFHCSTIGIEFE